MCGDYVAYEVFLCSINEQDNGNLLIKWRTIETTIGTRDLFLFAKVTWGKHEYIYKI